MKVRARVAMLPSIRLIGAAALLSAAAAAAPVGPSFVPVYRTDFPDPHIVRRGAELVAYATNSAGINLPMATSRDLVTWTDVADPAKPGKRRDGMPVLAPWVKEGRTWAPEVMQIGGRWLLYYTALNKKRDTQCIGVAASDSLGGAKDLVRAADGAMYAAKKAGKGRVEVFQPRHHAAEMARQQLRADLQQALDDDQFVLY